MADETAVARPVRRRRIDQESPTPPNALDIADAEAGDQGPDGPARRVSLKQEKLIEADLRHRRWQIVSERMSVGLKTLTAVAGLALAAVACILIWEASRYQGLVVQAFSVPPELANRGMTGEVVAGEVLDRLVEMQGKTDSVRAPGSYAIDWGHKIEVQIPETGVSIGDLQRSLRSWLGQETRISGVVYRAADGSLAVTARIAGSAGHTISGADTDLPGLLQRAAEDVYARTQPYRYTIYLAHQGRQAEELAFYATAANWPQNEQAWRHRGWGLAMNETGDSQGALSQYRQALEFEPNMGATWYVVFNDELNLSRLEPALRAARNAVKFLPRAHDLSVEGGRDIQRYAEAYLAAMQGDYLPNLRSAAVVGAGATGTDRSRQLELAQVQILRHEWSGPERISAALKPWQGRDLVYLSDDLNLYYTRLVAAVAREDAPATLARAADYEAIARTRLSPQDTLQRVVWPILAPALAATGRLDDARRLAASLPSDCVDCLLARAKVADIAGDSRAADRWFAEAERISPSLPQAPLAWGESLLKRARAAAAEDKLRQAVAKGPRFADPLEYLGEALLARGDPKAAAEKFAAAAKLTPRWGRLQLKWGEALASLGKADEAGAKWRAAVAMDLTSAERARAEALLAKRTP